MEVNKIYLGDAYELIKAIPDKSVDLIIIDPPYDIETDGGKLGKIGKSMQKIRPELSKLSNGIDTKIFDSFMRIMKKPNIYIWCNKKQIYEYLKYFAEDNQCSFEILVWCKTNPIPLCGGNYLIDKEFCLYFRKGVKLNTTIKTAFTYWQLPINNSDKKELDHPTIKPIQFIKNFILNSSNENDVVLDCFVGSGTTCLAAKQLGRNYIGMEIDEKWHKIAVDRLNGISARDRDKLDNGQTSLEL